MKKKNYSYSDRLFAVKRVINDHLSLAEVGRQMGTDHKQIRRWVGHYQAYGAKGLRGNKKRYPLNFKIMVVGYMKENNLSLFETAIKFGILNESVIGSWKRSFENPHSPMDKNRKDKSLKDGYYTLTDPQTATREELLKELEYMHAENAFLKKLRALTAGKKHKSQKSSGS